MNNELPIIYKVLPGRNWLLYLKVLNRRSSVIERWKDDKLYKCNNGDLIYNATSIDNPNLNIKTTSYRHYFL